MTSYEAWAWVQFLAALDRAGYAIVKKPELTDKGLPSRARARA